MSNVSSSPVEELLSLYKSDERVKQVSKFLANADDPLLYLRGLSYSARALVIATLCKRGVVVCSERDDAPYLYHDLVKLLGEDKVYFLPSSFKHRPSADGYDAQNIQLRTEAISQLFGGQDVLVVTYPQAVSEKVITTTDLEENTLKLRCGERISIQFLTDVLIEYGFERADFVYEPGQYSIRGSIVDIFSFASDVPYRVDFFGDEVDSIRTFELDSQLSVNRLDEVLIVPDLSMGSTSDRNRVSLIEALPKDMPLWVEQPDLTIDIISQVFEQAQNAVREVETLPSEDTKRISINDFVSPDDWAYSLSQRKRLIMVPPTYAIPDGSSAVSFTILTQPTFKKNFDLLEDDIYYRTADEYKVYILSDNSRQLDRLSAILKERKRKLKYHEVKTTLHSGFVDTSARLCVYTDHQIFERYHKYALRNEKMRASQQSITLKELSQLKVGDYVVHIDHGICVFNGLTSQEVNGRVTESVLLSFAGSDRLFVNVQSLHKISKYRGKEGVEPKIRALGSAYWDNLKEKTKRHVKDIASNLIKLYARRKDEAGFAFSPDTFLQQELEASFFYEDTPDQYKATQAIKRDMEKSSPMDRLVCGDVGFGKTELAIRAAFKAVSDNKQVAVLVPTTVLAFQHYNTFKQRLKDFPCKIEYVSRLRKTSETRAVLKGVKEGTVDIVIGTHRLIGKDVEFKDLGLLIIDEEQRFGVAVKEKLKELKVNVDTLTLTATPIPRTLQFSLMGARDLSVLQTPPSNRQPIQTEVRVFSEEAMCEAIKFEVDRGGQVFIINNRINHLLELQRVLAKLMPDLRTVVGHGQMDGMQLESIMLDFIDGEYDVLLATTIIESGLDIPNANTIIINNAHMFGLSELHQLRGRVGRSNKKAYCYLFAPPLAQLTQEGRRRLKIIGEFSDLGSGFNIAMQDLDIRGTGNVLGAEQSGFISDIGYETYQKILQEALIELKQNDYKELFKEETGNGDEEEKIDVGELMFVSDTQVDTDEEAIFPQQYIESISERMSLYKEADSLQSTEAIDEFKSRLVDRFGPLPEQAEALLQIVDTRIMAQKLGIEKLILKKEKLILHFVSDPNSAFYQSPIFACILNWMQQNGRKVSLKEEKGRLSMIFKEPMNIDKMVVNVRDIYMTAMSGNVLN
ncbi:MAG: transcription-repair coupling factor [Bacteroidia bacterium]|nr:transcription-repair coupling factor [Bacteroidia bacterium]